MSTFLILTEKLIPLYVLILLGFIAGKIFKPNKESISNLLIYFIAPIVTFYGISHEKFQFQNLNITLLAFVIATIVYGIGYIIGKFIWKDETKNIFAFVSASGNTGYFGFPVIIAVFGIQYLPYAILFDLGYGIFGGTIGFLFTAKGKHTIKESLIKTLKLPGIYAMILGIIISYLGINLGEDINTLGNNFLGAFSILGMMLIGISLAEVKRVDIDKIFISLSLVIKFLIWPILMLIFLKINNSYLNLFSGDTEKILIVLSCVPMAVSSVIVANMLKIKPEKAALAVIISTLLAMIYIPLVLTIIK